MYDYPDLLLSVVFVWAELGVLNWVLDADNYEHDAELQKIRQDRGYTYHVCEKSVMCVCMYIITSVLYVRMCGECVSVSVFMC